MSAGSRPGGLTALAVINFVLCAFDLLGALGKGMALLAHRGVLPMSDEQRKNVAEVIVTLGEPAFVLQLAWDLACAVLLLPAGIGYIKMRRFLGRTVGNVYALVSIGFAATFFWLVGQQAGGVVGFAVLPMVIYPVLTLFLLNTTFKEDFVR